MLRLRCGFADGSEPQSRDTHAGGFGCVPGGGPLVGGGDLQAAAEGGGQLGADQGAVGPHRVLAAHLAAGGAGLRDPEETEPAIGPDPEQTLVRAGTT